MPPVTFYKFSFKAKYFSYGTSNSQIKQDYSKVHGVWQKEKLCTD